MRKTQAWNSGGSLAFSNQGLKHAEGLCVCVSLSMENVCAFLKGSAEHKISRKPHLVAWLSGRAVFYQTLPLDTGAKEHYQGSI